MRTIPRPWRPLGFEQISDVSTAKFLTVPDGAIMALIQVETSDVRWRDDGTAPTDSVGMLLTADGQPLEYNGDLSKIRLIDTDSGASVNVTYYGIQ